jgi:hypothetical protein
VLLAARNLQREVRYIPRTARLVEERLNEAAEVFVEAFSHGL